MLQKYGDKNEAVTLRGLSCILKLTESSQRYRNENVRQFVKLGARNMLDIILARPTASEQVKQAAGEALESLA